LKGECIGTETEEYDETGRCTMTKSTGTTCDEHIKQYYIYEFEGRALKFVGDVRFENNNITIEIWLDGYKEESKITVTLERKERK